MNQGEKVRWGQCPKTETGEFQSTWVARRTQAIVCDGNTGAGSGGARRWTNRQVQNHSDLSLLADPYNNPHHPECQGSHLCQKPKQHLFLYVWGQVKGNQWSETAEWRDYEAAWTVCYITAFAQVRAHWIAKPRPSLESTCALSSARKKPFQACVTLCQTAPCKAISESSFLGSEICSLSSWGNGLFLTIMLNLALGQCMWSKVRS